MESCIALGSRCRTRSSASATSRHRPWWRRFCASWPRPRAASARRAASEPGAHPTLRCRSNPVTPIRDRERMLRHAVVAVAAIALAVIWVRLAVRPSSDLLNHREFGRRFIEGSFLYDGGLDYPYLPTWALAHAPLAGIPSGIVSAVVFPVGVAALALIVWILQGFARTAMPLRQDLIFWVIAAAVTLVARFLIRDLLDGGENLIVVGLTWAALWAWTAGRTRMAPTLLGLAIALKLTAAIFLLVLLVRRRYWHAAAAAVCVALLVVLPVVWMGGDSYHLHMQRWADGIRQGLGSRDATVGVLGPEPARNLSLRAAIGRLAVNDDAPSAERDAVSWLALALVALAASLPLMCWRWPPGVAGDVVAWALGGVVAVLVSPITWRAHLVAILPACYLLIHRFAFERGLHPAGLVGLAATAVPSLVLTRGVLGENISDWSDRWSITTGALVCLAIGLATWPNRR